MKVYTIFWTLPDFFILFLINEFNPLSITKKAELKISISELCKSIHFHYIIVDEIDLKSAQIKETKNILLRVLNQLNEKVTPPIIDSYMPFFMPIQDIFTITKTQEQAICGRVFQGSIQISDTIEIVGMQQHNQIGVVKRIEMFRKKIDKIYAGDVAAIFLENEKNLLLQTGQVLSQPGTLYAYQEFDAILYIYTKEEGGLGKQLTSTKYIQYFFYNTIEAGSLEVKNVSAYPGDFVEIHAVLNQASPIYLNLSFCLEDDQKLIGAGTITKLYEKTFEH